MGLSSSSTMTGPWAKQSPGLVHFWWRFVMVGLLDWSLKNCRSLSPVDWEVGVMDLVGNTMGIKRDAKTCHGKKAAATRTTQTDPFMT